MTISVSSLPEQYSYGPVIGSGAYGSVFRGRHRLSKVRVSIKRIPKAILREEAAHRHFQQEITILRDIDRDLLHHVNSHDRMSEDECRRLFIQLWLVIKFLHIDRRIVHRDLKLENVLLDKYGNVRLIDFGFAKSLRGDDFLRSRCGSPAYVAPEIVSGAAYTSAVDIWSLGVILYCLTLRSLPFKGSNVEEQLRKVVTLDP